MPNKKIWKKKEKVNWNTKLTFCRTIIQHYSSEGERVVVVFRARNYDRAIWSESWSSLKGNLSIICNINDDSEKK